MELLIILGLLYLFFRSRKRAQNGTTTRTGATNISVPKIEKEPYKKKDYFFTRAERSFYEVLRLVVRDMEVHVFAKVRMADLVYIPKGTKSWQTYWNRIRSKHVDFVICDKAKIQPLLVIELDDSSHAKESRVKRDQFVDQAYQDAGLPLLRFPVKQAYVTNDIEAQIRQILGQKLVGEHP